MSAGTASWDAEVTGDGSLTLRSPVHGEACHSRSGAWGEARERYVRACRLGERLAPDAPALRVLEIGTGLGWNIAAALEAAALAHGRIEVTTFELDERVIRRALELGACALAGGTDALQWIAATLAALAHALDAQTSVDDARAVPLAEHGTLRLVLGDARATVPALAPSTSFDAIFMDAFSPGVEPELWDPRFLRELAARLAPGGLLSTYSAATRVRAALLGAGLRVGPGPRFGTKAEGTLASPDLELERFPARVERRLERRARELSSDGRASSPAVIPGESRATSGLD